MPLGFFRQAIRAAGVSYQNQVGLFGRLAETLNKVRLILADRVDADFEL